MDKVIWKDIPGFEGYYQINRLGQVKSLPRITVVKNVSRRNSKPKDEYWNRTGRLLKPVMEHGRTVVRLYKEGQPRKSIRIDKLIEMCFTDAERS